MIERYKSINGITLVVLVITIVVLLILAGITINMLFSDNGIIKKAQKAADETNQAAQNEQQGLQNLEDPMNTALGENKNSKWSQAEDGSISNGKIVVHIGDYINYDCKTGATTLNYTSIAAKSGWTKDQIFTLADYNYGWRVLGVDEVGQLQIIAEDFAPLTGGSSSKGRAYYYLQDQEGYVNGIEELNKISEIYGQGKGATGGRSITAEDVNKITGYNPNNTGVRDVAQSGNGTKYQIRKINEYGNQITYTRPSGTTVSYNGTNGLTGNYNQFSYYDGSSWISLGQNDGTSVNLTSNYYYYYPTTLTDTNTITASVGIGRNTNEYKMLFTNSSTGANSESVGTTDGCKYWLGSSFVNTRTGYAYFGVRYVIPGYVNGSNLCNSSGNINNSSCGVRPVVSLKSDISLEKATEQKDSCDLWNIK